MKLSAAIDEIQVTKRQNTFLANEFSSIHFVFYVLISIKTRENAIRRHFELECARGCTRKISAAVRYSIPQLAA